MKKSLLVLLILISLSCKNDKKDKDSSTVKEELKDVQLENNEEVLNKLIIPDHQLWTFNNLSFEEDLSLKREGAFKITRTSISESAYIIVKDIPVIFGSKYRLNILAKKAQTGNLFGFRVTGEYPNRIDAVFDLANGFIKDVQNSGNFIVGKAEISPLENGWFKCSIITEFDADMVKLIFGPTSGLRKAIAWEAQTNDFCDSYVIPSSLTLEEISN